MHIASTFDWFWMRTPALLYALALSVGVFAVLSGEYAACGVAGLFLLFPALSNNQLLRARLLLALCVGLCGFAYAATAYRLPVIEETGIEGVAEFVPEAIRKSGGRYGNGWVYSGRVVTFVDRNGQVVGKNFSAGVQVRDEDRPDADRAYCFRCRLKQSANGNYFLVVPRKGNAWVPVEGGSALCEWRCRMKECVCAAIKEKIADARSGTFLAGIATGSFDDNEMFVELGRFGLQHIMAISGFHFAIIAAIMGQALKTILPTRISIPLLILVMSGYFLFLGAGPSIVRAWLTVVLALTALLLNRTVTGLNTLGTAVFLIVLYDPLMVQKIGFQFSALMTLAILLFYPPAEVWLRRWIPHHIPGKAQRMSPYDQYGCVILTFIRSAAALTIAVNLFAIPLTLLYFHKFPVLGLLYNLFFPFLVSMAMLLLILGLVFPFAGEPFHFLNNLFTTHILNFVYHVPSNVDLVMRVEALSGAVVALVMCGGIVAGIVVRRRTESFFYTEGDSNFGF